VSYVGFLPWWVAIIVWVLAIVSSVVMGFFIILYTFEFGLDKTKAWCVAVLTSFFFGLLLEQPVKIILVAFALALICRKSSDIYPTEMDIVADHSVRGTTVCLSALPSLSMYVYVCVCLCVCLPQQTLLRAAWTFCSKQFLADRTG